MDEGKDSGRVDLWNAQGRQKKIHPDLTEWDKLSEEERRKDRDAVREIPQRLADVGFEIYRYEEKSR